MAVWMAWMAVDLEAFFFFCFLFALFLIFEAERKERSD
jgi:hypothetical protein